MDLKRRLWMIGAMVLAACAAALGIYWLCAREAVPAFEAGEVRALFTARGKQLWQCTPEGDVLLDIRGVTLPPDVESDAELLRMAAQMNANAVFLSETADEAFYRTLTEFNRTQENGLYLLQGMNAQTVAQRRAAVDMLHECGLGEWVIGYVLTAEADGRGSAYQGTYLSSAEGASDAEARLARIGDELLCYEASKYGVQRLIAFAGTPQTDPLTHDTCAQALGLTGNVDFEHILCGDALRSGVFALYQVGADELFFELEPFYADDFDETGSHNPYRGYLRELCAHHEMPVVLSGLNVPTARGTLSEAQQAQKLPALYKDMRAAGCAGILMSAWLDEWQLWSDVQNPDEAAGVIALEPGREGSVCRVDGEMSDWEQVPLLVQGEGMLLQMQYDARFVFFRVYAEAFDTENERLYIPVDLSPAFGGRVDAVNGQEYDRDADAVIVIDGANSRWMIHRDFDQTGEILPQTETFRESLVLIREEITLDDGRVLSAQLAPAGKLIWGEDIAARGAGIEIRIPWTLMGFENPARGVLCGADGRRTQTKTLYAGLIRTGKTEARTQMEPFSLDGWDEADTHIRFKPGYYEMKRVFGEGA